MAVDPTTTKYVIHASIHADGVVERPDIIGAIFGQTEGLLGNEMDMRDLQKSARIGRIEVEVEQKNGKTTGTILVPSALEKVESAVLAAGLETIDRIGPAKARITVKKIVDAQSSRREQVRKRAQELLKLINTDPSQDSDKILEEVKNAVEVEAITFLPGTKLPCGPNVMTGESIIIVEGRSDVLNLLKCGIKNAIAVEGTDVPDAVKDLSQEKTTTIFVDGDRGGELIARELLETCEIDFVARAPSTREVEELPHKLVMKCLKNKLTADQFVSNLGITVKKREAGSKKPAPKKAATRDAPRRESSDEKSDKPARGRGRRGRDSKDRDEEAPKRDASEDRPARKAPARKDEDRRPAKKVEKKAAHDPRASIRETLEGLSGTLKAVVLDTKGGAINDGLPVRELADTLKSTRKKIQSVIFDGVITQRLLDIAADKSIATIVGVKMGNVTKVPDDVEVLTKDDL